MQWMLILNWGDKRSRCQAECWSRVLSVPPLSETCILSKWECCRCCCRKAYFLNDTARFHCETFFSSYLPLFYCFAFLSILQQTFVFLLFFADFGGNKLELKSGKREVKRVCMRTLLTSHQRILIIGSQTQRPESMIDAQMMNECEMVMKSFLHSNLGGIILLFIQCTHCSNLQL